MLTILNGRHAGAPKSHLWAFYPWTLLEPVQFQNGMRPLVKSKSRHLSGDFFAIQGSFRRSVLTPLLPPKTKSGAVCLRCQLRAYSYTLQRNRINPTRLQTPALLQTFSSTVSAHRKDELGPQQTQKHEPAVEESELPSNLERRRTIIYKRISTLTDSLLSSLNQVSHQVNTYAGTDYTPITNLRNAISDQESRVRASYGAVALAKEAYDAAHSQQISSQKEVVGLLERKSSWSATDLERYMALIRSEHTNEQDVTMSLSTLREKERDLEEGRRQLEKMERQQYHEEQVWSDTIRRNSTWVTIGLMGVNILLLLVNIVGVEPWRRRRLVREVKKALDEKTLQISAVLPAVDLVTDNDIDRMSAPEDTLSETGDHEKEGGDAELQAVVVETQDIDSFGPGTGETDAGDNVATIMPIESRSLTRLPSRYASWEIYIQDIFSERLVSLRKVDVTYVALQGAATGVAFMGILFVFLRPK